MIFRVGVLYQYFAATSDELAAAAIDLPGGPAGVQSASPELREAFRRGDQDTLSRLMKPRVHGSEHGFDVLSVNGIDPVVQVGSLEELLTDASFEVVLARPRAGMDVAVRGGGEQLVLSLSDELQQALTAATAEQLSELAEPWSRT